jgi:hypothetical protein
MTAAEIIRALGGATQIAREIEVGRSAVSMWPRHGIPGRYWPALVRMASMRGIKQVTLDALESHTAEHGRRARPDIYPPPHQASEAAA